LQVRSFTVGPVQENCYILFKEGSNKALIIDPGEESQRLIAALTELGVELEAILLTHCHYDHVGAVADVAEHTGVPTYCPELELFVLEDLPNYAPPQLGPFKGYKADKSVKGGEKLNLAGFEIDVIFTPGHSPGHVTYSVPEYGAIFSGDVLFQGSVGRTDLPGADHNTLLQSIDHLLKTHPDETTVYPGHMGITTLGREREVNPFLAGLTG